MSVFRSNEASIGFTEETQAQFGTNISGSGTYTEIPVYGLTHNKLQENLAVELTRQRRHANTEQLEEVGFTRGDVSFNVHAQGAGGTGLGPTDAPSTHFLSRLLGLIMGGVYASSGANIVAATSSSITCDTSEEAGRFPVGVNCMVHYSGGTEVRRVKARSGAVLTIDPPLPVDMASGSVLHNGYHHFHTNYPTGSAQFYVKDVVPELAWVFMGGQGGFEIEQELGQLVNFSFSFMHAAWTSGSTQDLGRVTYGAKLQKLIKNKNGNATFVTQSCPTVPPDYKIASLNLTPNIGWIEAPTVAGVNGLDCWVANAESPALEMVVLTENKDWYENREDRKLHISIAKYGSAPGATMAITNQAAQINNIVDTDVGGLHGSTISNTVFEDNTDTASTGFEEIRDSVTVISLF